MTKNPSTKHGSTKRPADVGSESQADGTAADAPRGEAGNPEFSGAAQQPRGIGNVPANASRVRSETPENRDSRINPSTMEATEGGETTEAGARPVRDDSLIDSAGEVGGSDVHKLGHITVDSTEPNAPSSGPSPTSEKPGKEGAGDLRNHKDDDADEAA